MCKNAFRCIWSRYLHVLLTLFFLVHGHFLVAQAHRATSKLAAEDAIRESVIRYQMKDFKSDISFVEIDGKDPTDDFMKRLRDMPGIVRKASASAFNKENMSVVDKETGKRGTIFQTGSIRWLSRDAVTVEGGYYCGGRCAAGIQFSVKRKNGKWVVISGHTRWVS
jgi:hypothetical protein